MIKTTKYVILTSKNKYHYDKYENINGKRFTIENEENREAFNDANMSHWYDLIAYENICCIQMNFMFTICA